MKNWDGLTPVQADAVIATAISCQTDPDELLGRLLPLLTDKPIEPDVTPLTLIPVAERRRSGR
jgi:hypothetical protein